MELLDPIGMAGLLGITCLGCELSERPLDARWVLYRFIQDNCMHMKQNVTWARLVDAGNNNQYQHCVISSRELMMMMADWVSVGDLTEGSQGSANGDFVLSAEDRQKAALQEENKRLQQQVVNTVQLFWRIVYTYSLWLERLT